MPNRIIKESINESLGLSIVSSFSRDLYTRLITYADDYGRFNSDPPIMRARLYPRELIAVTEEDIIDALAELSSVDKVRLYVGENQRTDGVFGYFPYWSDHQRIRQSRAKWPEPGVDEINDWYLRRFVPSEMKIALCERDGFICQECRKDFSLPGIPTKRAIRLLGGAIHIDHIIPVSAGGRATEGNLRVLCASCNLHRPRSSRLEEMVRGAPSSSSTPLFAAARGKSRPESNPIQSESNPNPNPNPIQSGDSDSSTDFNAFIGEFKAMGRDVGKVKAKAAWLTTTVNGRSGKKAHPPIAPSVLITAAKHYRKKCEMEGTEPKFIKQPATFLGPDRHWEDYSKPPVRSSGGSPGQIVNQRDVSIYEAMVVRDEEAT